MSEPDVVPWAEIRLRRQGLVPRSAKLPQDYDSFEDYFADTVEPALNRPAEPAVNLGYPRHKRRGVG